MSDETFHRAPRFNAAVAAIDQANSLDPKSAKWNGLEGPRELLFATRVFEWVLKIDPFASEALLLAARAHTLRRWEIPRAKYEMNRRGYHGWRDACARHHATVAQSLLTQHGYESPAVDQVLDLILKKNWPADPAAQMLEDADCLAFLEMKLANYVDEWEGEKAINILRRTLRKMTPKARELAAGLTLEPRAAELVRSAMQ